METDCLLDCSGCSSVVVQTLAEDKVFCSTISLTQHVYCTLIKITETQISLLKYTFSHAVISC